MRLKTLIATMAAVIGLVAIAVPAEAGHRKPAGWGEVRTVKHYGYYPRYNHVYYVHYRTDPHVYNYEPRRYYPYYNSGYWRPAHEVRRNRTYNRPAYYQAWGYPNPYYQQRKRRHW